MVNRGGKQLSLPESSGRRVIARIERGGKGGNPRHVVTDPPENPRKLHERIYRARGELENCIRERPQLFSGRTPAHHWWPNQFRLLLSSLAYILLETIRLLGLKRTGPARAQAATVRFKLLRIGAVMLRNTRRARFLPASAHPFRHLRRLAAHRLDTN